MRPCAWWMPSRCLSTKQQHAKQHSIARACTRTSRPVIPSRCHAVGMGRGYAHIPLLCVQCADLCLHVGFVVAQADTLRWLSSSSSCCTATQRKGRLPKALSTLPPSKAALPRYTRQLVPSCDRARITSLAHTTVLPVPDCNSWHKQSTKYKTPTKPCVELSAMRLA